LLPRETRSGPRFSCGTRFPAGFPLDFPIARLRPVIGQNIVLLIARSTVFLIFGIGHYRTPSGFPLTSRSNRVFVIAYLDSSFSPLGSVLGGIRRPRSSRSLSFAAAFWIRTSSSSFTQAA